VSRHAGLVAVLDESLECVGRFAEVDARPAGLFRVAAPGEVNERDDAVAGHDNDVVLGHRRRHNLAPTTVECVARRKLALELGQEGAGLVCAGFVPAKVPEILTELEGVYPTAHAPSLGLRSHLQLDRIFRSQRAL